MRKLLFFVLTILLILISCDGRHRAHKSNQEILKEHKLYKTFSENIKFIPETYSEINTDTVLSNGFNVTIKTYTDMDTSYLNEFTKDTIHHKNYYRNLRSFVKVSKDSQELTSILITKDFFSNYDKSYTRELENKAIQGIWLNEYTSVINDKVVLNVLFCTPNTKDYLSYTIIINKNGDYLIKNELEPVVI